MENRNLAKGNLGPHGTFSADLVNNNVQLSVSYSAPEVSVSLSATVNSKQGLEDLKKLIPGQIDDAVINVIEAALTI